MPMLITIFPLVKTPDLPKHPAEHGIDVDVVVVPPSLRSGATSRINPMRNEPFPLPPLPAKGTHRIAGKEPVTTIIFQHGQAELGRLEFEL